MSSKFRATFNVTYSDNHWSNTANSIELFEQIIFPYVNNVKKSFNYPEEQMSLVIMDTFKDQVDDDVIMELCMKTLSILLSFLTTSQINFNPST